MWDVKPFFWGTIFSLVGLSTQIIQPVQAQPPDRVVLPPLTAATPKNITRIPESNGTTVILPANYESGQTYPAVVLMPFTGGSASRLFDWAFSDVYQARQDNPFIVILPAGQGSRYHWSGQGWQAIVNQYEGFIQRDLTTLVSKYNIDQSKLLLGGLSLGGDLSWALSLRNPDIFSGAIVLGSMSTYRDAGGAAQLADNDFRYFMVMGQRDSNHRAMQGAIATLNTHQIDYRYAEIPNAAHGDLVPQMPTGLFMEAVDYILFD